MSIYNPVFSPDPSITLSPVYPAAATQLGSERGLSIRFPRFMKTREDKSWEQATTAEDFAEMYRNQIKEAPARAQIAAPGPENVIRKLSEDRDVGENGEDDDEDEDDEEDKADFEEEEEM